MSFAIQDIISFGSLLAVSISIYKVYKFKEAAMRQDGSRIEQQARVAVELETAKKKIEELTLKLQCTDITISGMNGQYETDIKHIMEALGRIEKKLDDHIAKDSTN